MKTWLLVLAACAPMFAAPAAAHAFLDHAEPAVGSTVHAAPAQVRLWFTEELEPAFSTVQVSDASGKRVDKGDGQVDQADRTLLRGSVPPLAPGRYRVTWRVLSVDTHTTQGDFSFDVAR
ncbi:MAG TPA: copper resistance CopC family protein [Casimicrobiaceae bacterium]